MKKITKALLLLTGLVISAGLLHAQEEILIKKTVWGDYTNIQFSILSDSIINALDEHATKDVQFVLERNGVYFIAAEINNPDYHLRIKAEDGTGNLPLIMLKLNDETGDWPSMWSTQSDVTFENLHISYEHGDKMSQYGHKVNNFGGVGSRITFKGCYLERERQAPVRLAASDMDVLIEDCRIGNVGERNFLDGNGRPFDTRGNNADSVIIRNSTFYNVSDRLFRTAGSHINYVELDHITNVNHLGRHGCINLSTVNKAVITNWLSIDACMLGSDRSALVEEQTHFEGWEYRYLVSLDGEAEGVTTELEIHNNNFANTENVTDIWATIDSLNAPREMNPLMETIMGDAAVVEAFMEPEVVEFAKVNDFPYSIIDSVYAYYTPDDMNNRYGIYSHDTSVYIQNIDVAYSSSSVSYTAGVNGYPLGDLNAFPVLRDRWEQGLDPVSVENETASNFENSLSIYPNPFSTESSINYLVNGTDNVNVSVYATTGQLVNTLVSKVQDAGKYSVSWNGTNASGKAMATGTYLVVVKAGDNVDASYLMYTK